MRLIEADPLRACHYFSVVRQGTRKLSLREELRTYFAVKTQAEHNLPVRTIGYLLDRVLEEYPDCNRSRDPDVACRFSPLLGGHRLQELPQTMILSGFNPLSSGA